MRRRSWLLLAGAIVILGGVWAYPLYSYSLDRIRYRIEFFEQVVQIDSPEVQALFGKVRTQRPALFSPLPERGAAIITRRRWFARPFRRRFIALEFREPRHWRSWSFSGERLEDRALGESEEFLGADSTMFRGLMISDYVPKTEGDSSVVPRIDLMGEWGRTDETYPRLEPADSLAPLLAILGWDERTRTLSVR